jgi:hypothetical protein
MKLANLLSFVNSRERDDNPERGLVLSKRLKELLENTEHSASTTHDSASAADPSRNSH